MLDIDAFGTNTSRTFVIPNPGGKSRVAADPLANSAFFNVSDEVLQGSNPLLCSANPILNMIYQVRTLVHNSDPSQLRNYLIEEIKKFEQRAKADAIPTETVAAARYCLCTVIDETAAQTPWGGGGIWAKYSLLVTFHNETWGGEKFFQILAKVTQAPAVHRDFIELLFFCISLGFEGRYRIVPNGQSQLELLRRRLAEIIADLKCDQEKTLSPHWQSVIKPRPPIWTILPAWISALFGVIAIASIFIVFSFKLSDTSDDIFMRIMAAPVPVLQQVSVPASVEGQVSALLQEEITKKLVTVQEASGVAVVTLLGDGLFPSGSISVNPIYYAVIGKIGLAIRDYGRGAVISGYTDNIPIRSARFPSNWHLSMARAKAVMDYLQLALPELHNLKAQGMGEAEAIASNSTAEGRAINRRVEIKILLSTSN